MTDCHIFKLYWYWFGSQEPQVGLDAFVLDCTYTTQVKIYFPLNGKAIYHQTKMTCVYANEHNS